MTDAAIVSQTATVAAVRRFSRFYTRQLGLLGEGLLHSDFSLTEARVLYNSPTGMPRRRPIFVAILVWTPGISVAFSSASTGLA